MSKEYKIKISQGVYREHTFLVDCDDPGYAKIFAMEAAETHDFSKDPKVHVDYEVLEVDGEPVPSDAHWMASKVRYIKEVLEAGNFEAAHTAIQECQALLDLAKLQLEKTGRGLDDV